MVKQLSTEQIFTLIFINLRFRNCRKDLDSLIYSSLRFSNFLCNLVEKFYLQLFRIHVDLAGDDGDDDGDKGGDEPLRDQVRDQVQTKVFITDICPHFTSGHLAGNLSTVENFFLELLDPFHFTLSGNMINRWNCETYLIA